MNPRELTRSLRDFFGGGADISADNPLQVYDPKIGSLISYDGVTDANGAENGSTLVCSDLTTQPNFDGNQVIITSGDYTGQARDISGATTGGTVTPHTAFGGQIVSGTTFVIAAIRTVPAEVAELEAKIGTPTGASVSADIAALGAMLVALGLQSISGSVSDVDPAVTDFDTDLTEVTNDHYNGMLLMFVDGVDVGQAHVIDDYDGTNKNCVFSAEDRWTDAPGNGDNFVILPDIGMMAKGIYTRLGTPAGASIAADIASIEAKTTNLPVDPADQSEVEAAIIAAALALEATSQLIKTATDNLPVDPADQSEVEAAITAKETYFEQTIPIKMNCTQTITAANADKDFIGDDLTGASGLISTDDAKVQKAFLLIIGRAVNIYAGTNALDCTTDTWNQWQMNLDGGAYGDLTNEEDDGQMLDNDWRCPVEGAIHPFTFMFDVTTELTNIDGKIGVRLTGAQAEQISLITTIDVYLKVLWKL